MTNHERFTAKVKVFGDCSIWTGARTGRGYGQFNVGRKHVRAHRYAYETYVGKIPSGMHVCHRCDEMLCVKLPHLFLGTRSDNMRDCRDKGRLKTPNANMTHCHRGHEYTPKNTGHTNEGRKRFCRKCKAFTQGRRKEARRG